MKSLAIEREFGSGGREIGKKVAEKAGISCYDDSLIAQVAEAKGVSLDMLKEYDEKRTGSVLYNIGLLASYNYNRNNSQAFELYYELQKTIKALEMQGPAVFIGRSSTEILRDNPRTVRVFIYSSDMDKRIDRIVRTENVTPEQAKKMMEKKERERRDYFKFWTDKDWSDKKNYDMALNTSVLSPDECARILLCAIDAPSA